VFKKDYSDFWVKNDSSKQAGDQENKLPGCFYAS